MSGSLYAHPPPPALESLVGAVLKNITIQAVVLVVQDGTVDWLQEAVRGASLSGVSVCTLAGYEMPSEETLAQVADPCFVDHTARTIVTIGEAAWTLALVNAAMSWTSQPTKKMHWISLKTDDKDIDLRGTSPVESTFFLKWTVLDYSISKPGWQISSMTTTSDGRRLRNVGTWQLLGNELGRLELQESLVQDAPLNFHGRTLMMSGYRGTYDTFTESAVHICHYDSNNRTVCTGYVGEMMNLVSGSLNFTLENEMGGGCGSSSTPNSRIQRVANGYADVAVGTCVLTEDRVKIAKGSEWFNLIGTFIATAALKPAKEPFMVIKVFTWKVWLAIVTSLAVVTVAVAVTASIKGEKSRLASIPFKAIVSQGTHTVPLNSSLRFLVALTWCFAVPLLAVYSGSLTAFYSSPSYETPVESLSDIAARKDKVPVVYINDPVHQMLMNKTGVMGAVLKKLVFSKNFTTEALAERIVYGDVAYINSERSIIKWAAIGNKATGAVGRQGCGVHVSRSSITHHALVLYYSQNSIVEDAINRRIRMLRSFGIIQKVFDRFNVPDCFLEAGKSHKFGNKKDQPTHLRLDQLQGAFWIYLLGTLTAIILFMLEAATGCHTKMK